MNWPDEKSLLVSVSGVRGLVPQGLNPEIILRFALAFGIRGAAGQGSAAGRLRIVLARDNRPSGPMVAAMTSAALNSLGYDVIDLGVAPTPALKAAVVYKHAAGGIMISASHNPVTWNAFKFVDHEGLFLSAGVMNDIAALAKSEDFFSKAAAHYADYKSTGRSKRSEAWKKYVTEIIEKNGSLKKIKKARFKVAVDPVCGAASHALPLLLKKMGCRVVKLNCTVRSEFPRQAEPNVAALGAFADFVKKNKCDAGFAVDPDGDRLAVVDENGRILSEEWTLPLALKTMLPDLQPSDAREIVINMSTSMVNTMVAEEAGFKVSRSAVGEANVVTMMQQKGIMAGGEGNGGVIDLRYTSRGRCSLVASSHILSLMAESRQKLSELTAGFDEYIMTKYKADADALDSVGGRTEAGYKALAEKLQQQLGEAVSTNLVDGLYLQYEDSWLHIRPSNTEPIVRIIFETRGAGRQKELAEKVNKIFTILE